MKADQKRSCSFLLVFSLGKSAVFEALPGSINKGRYHIAFNVLTSVICRRYKCILQELPHTSRTTAANEKILDKENLLVLTYRHLTATSSGTVSPKVDRSIMLHKPYHTGQTPYLLTF